MLLSAVSDLGLHYLLRPVSLNTWGKYDSKIDFFWQCINVFSHLPMKSIGVAVF